MEDVQKHRLDSAASDVAQKVLAKFGALDAESKAYLMHSLSTRFAAVAKEAERDMTGVVRARHSRHPISGMVTKAVPEEG